MSRRVSLWSSEINTVIAFFNRNPLHLVMSHFSDFVETLKEILMNIEQLQLGTNHSSLWSGRFSITRCDM